MTGMRALGAVVFAIFFVAGVAAAEEIPAPTDVERGQVLFRFHCQGCHGAEGRGDGPVAEHLRDRPADLTILEREAGGRFPAERIHRIIDGRDEVPVHGTREMPVWALSFREPGLVADQEADIAGRISDLVRYLGSIQVE